jgi:hypothetical protein
MAVSAKKTPANRAAAQKLAARRAEELAKALHSFAGTLSALDTQDYAGRNPTPRNWWRLQAGRFKSDPSFPEFVAEVQASRRREA